MEVPKTSSGKPCKLCIAKGGPCHLHGGTPKKLSSNTKVGSFGSALGTYKTSGPKKSSSRSKTNSPKRSTPKKSSPKIHYLDKIDKDALSLILMAMERRELNIVCNQSAKAKKICDAKWFREAYEAKHALFKGKIVQNARMETGAYYTYEESDEESDSDNDLSRDFHAKMWEDEAGNALELVTDPEDGEDDEKKISKMLDVAIENRLLTGKLVQIMYANRDIQFTIDFYRKQISIYAVGRGKAGNDLKSVLKTIGKFSWRKDFSLRDKSGVPVYTLKRSAGKFSEYAGQIYRAVIPAILKADPGFKKEWEKIKKPKL